LPQTRPSPAYPPRPAGLPRLCRYARGPSSLRSTRAHPSGFPHRGSPRPAHAPLPANARHEDPRDNPALPTSGRLLCEFVLPCRSYRHPVPALSGLSPAGSRMNEQERGRWRTQGGQDEKGQLPTKLRVAFLLPKGYGRCRGKGAHQPAKPIIGAGRGGRFAAGGGREVSRGHALSRPVARSRPTTMRRRRPWSSPVPIPRYTKSSVEGSPRLDAARRAGRDRQTRLQTICEICPNWMVWTGTARKCSGRDREPKPAQPQRTAERLFGSSCLTPWCRL
jgi:hypothetical protein